MISHIAAGIVGVVLAYAGAQKVTAFSTWLDSARQQNVAKVIAYALPPSELLLGALLVGLGAQVLTLALATLLLLAFTAFLVAQIASKATAPCACFGSTRMRPPRWIDVVRNLVLIALLVVSAAAA